MKPTRVDTILIFCMYGAEMGIVALQAFGFASAVSALFAAGFFCVALLWLSTAWREVTKRDYLMLLTLLAALLCILPGAGPKAGLSYFKKYAMLCAALLFFQAASKLRIDARTERWFCAGNSALCLLLIVLFLLRREEMYLIDGVTSRYLTFGFTNPNLAGMFLVCLSMRELIHAKRHPLHLVLGLVMAWFVMLSGSRNCMLALGIFLIWCFVSKPISDWAAALIAVLPGIFVGLYFALNTLMAKMLPFMASEGKTLSSRLDIWSEAFSYYDSSPILGAYGQLVTGNDYAQLHNSHLDILVSYGPVVLILVCLLLFLWLRGRKGRDLGLAAFGCTLLLGLGEAAVFSGGLGISILAGTFLLGQSGEEAA